MAEHNKLGKAGEQIAVDFLVSRGMIIRERNWRLNRLEIDIIAESKGMRLHIVEVKTRSSDKYFDPLKSITPAKKQHMVNSANAYIRYYQLRCEVQYDVIIIVGDENNHKIDYYPDLFLPSVKTYR